MRDAYGGIVNIVIIVVFLVIVSGYLAFNVNYTKAFRTKNRIISYFEEYEGNCEVGTECAAKIKDYMGAIGYNAANISINANDYNCANSSGSNITCNCLNNMGYCYVRTIVESKDGTDVRQKAVFKIITAINIDVPIINKILPGLRTFQVSGDTKQIVLP